MKAWFTTLFNTSIWRLCVRWGVLVVVCLYFVYHTVFGQWGWFKWQNLQHQEAALQVEYTQKKAERTLMNKKVQAMRPEHLDADLADEQARKTLGYTHPDEIVVELPQLQEILQYQKQKQKN